VREIARGGMGVVYEAEDVELRRRVAIKVLASELASEHAVEHMRDEARTIAKLEHPGIVPLHDASTATTSKACCRARSSAPSSDGRRSATDVRRAR